MDIRYLESLICVAELGSIARAAKFQNLTAAAVGQRIAILEDHFGAELLNRKSRNAVPTSACERLLPIAREIVERFHEMNSLLDDSGISGCFRLGSIPTALTGLLPGTIRNMAKLAPKLALEIKPGTSETLYADLHGRNLDAAILALPAFPIPERFSVELLREEPLVLLSGTGAGKTIREKLEGNPYISFDTKSWAGNGASRFLRDEKIEIEPFYELDAIEPIEKLVREGMGVSLVPQWPDMTRNNEGLEFEVIEDPKYLRRIALVTHSDSNRLPVLELLRSSLLANAQM